MLRGGTVDLIRRTFHKQEESISLTTKEAQLLAWLAERPGEPVTREQLLADLWEYSADMLTRTVDVTVRRLREKVEIDPANPHHILTIHGKGYVFEPLEAEAPIVLAVAFDPPIAGVGQVGDAPMVITVPASLAPVPVAPQPVAAPPPRTNLREEYGAFFGRDADVARVRQLVRQSVLVTISGPGGMGKTRLAKRVAAEEADGFPGGTWFADLSSVRTLEEVLPVVARVMQVPLGTERGEAAFARLTQAVRSRGKILLIMDNVEQLLGAATPLVQAFVSIAKESRVILTSREPTRVSGEHAYALGPLDAEAGAHLFVERGREALPGFTPTPDDDAAIAKLVQRLDGSPLAISLAAARGAVMRPAEILARLDEPLRLLRGRNARDQDRHASLRATIAWSWDLLSPAERQTLAQLSMFRAPFTLRAAEAVVELSDADLGEQTEDELVDALRDKSLLRVETDENGERRFALYEAVRHFAAEHVAEADRPALEARHSLYFLAAGEAWEVALEGRNGIAARHALHRATPDLLAVYLVCRENWPARAVRAVLALSPLLIDLGPADRVSALLDDALGLAAHKGWDLRAKVHLARARALQFVEPIASRSDFVEARRLAVELADHRLAGEAALGLAILALGAGEVETARPLLAAAGADFLRAGSPGGSARVVAALAELYFLRGEIDAALAAAARALDACRNLGARHEEARVLGGRGVLLHHMERLEESLADQERAAAIHRQVGDNVTLAMDLMHVGLIHADAQRDAEARTALEESLALNRAVGSRRGEGVVRGSLGWLALGRGELSTAKEHFTYALPLHREQANRPALGSDLAGLGATEHALGNHASGDAHFEEAVDALDGVGIIRLAALRFGVRGVMSAQRGECEAAASHFAEGERVLQSGRAPTMAAAFDLLQGLVDVARGNSEGMERARARVARVRTSVTRQPLDVRVSLVLLERATGEGRPRE